MGRAPCCDKGKVKRGPWSPEEDAQLIEYMEKHGTWGNWIALPQKAGLRRCGKSCRLRWLNYLRPNIKHGDFSDNEDRIICSLFARIGSRWSIIAGQLPGRTDNDIKNYWNTKLKKKLQLGLLAITTSHDPLLLPTSNNVDPLSKNPSSMIISSYSQTSSSAYDQSSYATTKYNNYITTPSIRANLSTAYEPIISPFSFTTTTTPVISSDFMAPSMLQFGHDHNRCVGHMHGDFNQAMIEEYGKSCSANSSDGSCTSNQVNISHVNNKVETNDQKLDFQSYFMSNGVDHDENNQEFLIISNDGYGNNGDQKRGNGCFSTEINPLEYSIEDIKQLISTGSICNNNLNFFLEDQIKTEGKTL